MNNQDYYEKLKQLNFDEEESKIILEYLNQITDIAIEHLNYDER